jgi:hypothetical protein
MFLTIDTKTGFPWQLSRSRESAFLHGSSFRDGKARRWASMRRRKTENLFYWPRVMACDCLLASEAVVLIDT